MVFDSPFPTICLTQHMFLLNFNLLASEEHDHGMFSYFLLEWTSTDRKNEKGALAFCLKNIFIENLVYARNQARCLVIMVNRQIWPSYTVVYPRIWNVLYIHITETFNPTCKVCGNTPRPGYLSWDLKDQNEFVR